MPCHPILLMIGSAQHELAKFLATLFQPVLELYSTNCINDSFSFAKMIQQLKVNSNDSILCSFDICSLFTNVPSGETIEICTKTLYDSCLPTPVIPKHVFIELIKTTTTSVEFSFNNIMYRQIDGVAMGSPFGPALADIFVAIMNQNFSMKFQNLPYTVVTLMTPFPFFTKKLNSKIFYVVLTCFTPP